MKSLSSPREAVIADTDGAATVRPAPAQWPAALLTALLLALLGLAMLSRAPLRDSQSFSLGSVASQTARGFHAQETSAAGHGFRWTDGDSTLVLPAQGVGAHRLELTLSAPWPAQNELALDLQINATPVVSLTAGMQPRHYVLLVPADDVRLSDNRVQIISPTFTPQENSRRPRELGVAVFDATWTSLNQPGWLVPTQVFMIALTGSLFWLALAAAGVGVGARSISVLLFGLIVLAMRTSDPRYVYRAQSLFWLAGIALLCALCLAAFRFWRPAQTVPRAALRDWLALHWPAFGGYALVTAALLFPLLLRFPSHIIGFPGDAYEYVWKMHWFAQALFGQQTSPAFAAHVFYPAGYEVGLSEMTPAHTLLGAPVTRLFGAVAGYNSVVVVSFLLSGIFTYLLAIRLGARRGAAFVAGLIVAFSARRFYHALGHMPMLGIQWAILAFYGWEGVLTRRRAWDGAVAGLGFALATWSSWYIGVTFALFLALYTPLRLGWRRLPLLLSAWRPTLVAGMITMALVMPLAQPYLELRSAGSMYRHSFFQLQLHAVRPIDYLLPNPLHPLWGDWARQFYLENGGEHIVTLGITATLLALAGVFVARRQRLTWVLVTLAGVNLVMTLGPQWQLPNGWLLPLPVQFVYNYVPVLDSIRVWSRMALYVAVCAALLAAFALSRLPTRWYRTGIALAAGLVLLETIAAYPLSAPQPRSVDVWIRDHPDAQVVIEMPQVFNGPGLLATVYTGKATNGGYGTFDPPLYREGKPSLDHFPSGSALRLLQRWQTDLVIVDEWQMARREPDWEQILAAEPRLERVYRADGFSVYALRR